MTAPQSSTSTVNRNDGSTETVAPAPGFALSLVLLGLWSLYHIVRQWGHWPDDLAALYIVGKLWATGQTTLIYAAPDGFFGGAPLAWDNILNDIGAGQQTAFAYIYPPLWAAIAAPLTRLVSAQAFFNAAIVAQVLMLAASIHLTGRIAVTRAPVWLWALVCICLLELTMPLRSALPLNQPSITVGFLIVLAFHHLARGSSGRAGFFLAMAAAIKLTPLVFVVLFVAERNWRAVGWFAICGAGFAAASLLLCGTGMHYAFLAALDLASQNTLLSAMNVSARALSEALLSLAAGVDLDLSPENTVFRAPGILHALTGLVNIAAFAGLSLWIHWRWRLGSVAQRRLVGLLGLSVGLFLFGPIGWQHYFVLPIMLLPGLASIFPLPKAIAIILPATLVESVFLMAVAQDGSWPKLAYVGIVVIGWLGTLLLIRPEYSKSNTKPRF